MLVEKAVKFGNNGMMTFYVKYRNATQIVSFFISDRYMNTLPPLFFDQNTYE